MRDLTKTQQNILKALRRGRPRPTQRIHIEVLECYDWRSLHGLFTKGYITWGQSHELDPHFTGKDQEEQS